MLVSVIPPYKELHWAKRGADSYHLTLAHEALQSDEYAFFYRSLSKQGHYVFLDNSAHELGTGMNVNSLLTAADRVGAYEMILPDRLFFADDTLELSEYAATEIKKQKPNMLLMGVPQGRTLDEWTTALSGLLELNVDCIGISKDYEVWPGGLRTLVKQVRAYSKLVEIHLLGWGRDPRQLYELSRDPKLNIRGVDSTKPFVYALHDQQLKYPVSFMGQEIDFSQPTYPRRKLDYFHETFGVSRYPLVTNNINVFRAYANSVMT